jgi:hypothetical protein
LALASATRPEAAFPAVVCVLLVLRGRPTTRQIISLMLPPLLLAGCIIGFDLVATGRPLPATFYFKQESSFAELPVRLMTAITSMLDRSVPFTSYFAWLGLAGLFRRPLSRRVCLPLAGGLGFLVSNLYVAPPSDPGAFYHLRYVLPALPLLTLGVVVGAARLGRWPLRAMLGAGIIGAAITLLPAAKGYHNDVRNINEVQVAMGRWIATNSQPGDWVAATDAGAVRYFGERPVVDLMGLNTPEFYWDRQAYVAAHPVDLLALMPAWVQPTDPSLLRMHATLATSDYTVTSYPGMAQQLIVGSRSQDASVRVKFGGLRRFEIDVRPWRPRGSR